MNLAIAATTLALIIPAELPDKTFISCVVLSSRYRPFYVWVGAASGLVVQAAIAVVAGKLLTLLPHTAVQSVVAALFLAGAAYMLFVPEKVQESEGKEIAEVEGGIVDGGAAGGAAGSAAGSAVSDTAPGPPKVPRLTGPPPWRIILSTFGIIVLAEFGDITQVLIANLTAHYRDPVSVFAGAAVGFCIVAVIGVMAGAILTRRVPLALVRKLSGAALGGFGVYSVVSLVSG